MPISACSGRAHPILPRVSSRVGSHISKLYFLMSGENIVLFPFRREIADDVEIYIISGVCLVIID